jgi:hypothetical protein
MASWGSAHFVIASRIRATASSVETITSSFGNRRTRKPCSPNQASRSSSASRCSVISWLGPSISTKKSPFKADEIKNMVAARNLPLKPGAIASPISKGAPNECLRLNGLRALFARKSTEYGPRDFLCHRVKLLSILRMLKIQSHRAPRDPPHPSLLRNDTFPREGGRGDGRGAPYGAARATSPADVGAAASRPSLA